MLGLQRDVALWILMCIPETLQTKHHVKWAKHENAVHLERKPYFLLQGGDAC